MLSQVRSNALVRFPKYLRSRREKTARPLLHSSYFAFVLSIRIFERTVSRKYLLCLGTSLTQLTSQSGRDSSASMLRTEFHVFPFDAFENERRFRAAMDAVEIARDVHYSLFTFGNSDLPYFLVLSGLGEDKTVSITKGEVKITRPMIITPNNAQPEFQNFFEDDDDYGLAQFILSRTASFSHLKMQNQSGPKKIVSDSVEEVVAKLNRQLDDEEEDHVAILTAPAPLAGFAILRYASERIMRSAPDNIQELRERGFLP